MSTLKFLLEVGTSYLCFGLALYAIGAITCLCRLRVGRQSNSPKVDSDIVRVCVCVVVLIVLEAARHVWDSFHYEHFPLWITQVALPTTFLVLGNSAFGLVYRELETEAPELFGEKAPKAAAAGSSQGGEFLSGVVPELGIRRQLDSALKCGFGFVAVLQFLFRLAKPEKRLG